MSSARNFPPEANVMSSATSFAVRQRVQIGPFLVDDLSRDRVVERAVDLAVAASTRPALMYALHVGGLNARADQPFVEEMNQADLVYADGGSVVLLGRLAGASRLERAPTTDIGWHVLERFGEREGRTPRLALVGGRPGLAEAAGRTLSGHGVGEVVYSSSGYPADWGDVVRDLAATSPDVCIVGLGAPSEMLWARAWADELPPSLVMTCGGWFGFLAGHEKRAPRLLRAPGLEWVSRVAQSPRRLGGRYARGLLTTAAVAVRTASARLLQ